MRNGEFLIPPGARPLDFEGQPELAVEAGDPMMQCFPDRDRSAQLERLEREATRRASILHAVLMVNRERTGGFARDELRASAQRQHGQPRTSCLFIPALPATQDRVRT